MKKLVRAFTVPQSIDLIRPFISDLQKDYELIILSSEGPEWEQVKRDFPNVKCIVVPIERRMSVISDIKSVYHLVKVFRRERPDIVHSMTGKSGILNMISAKISNVPYRIHTFTGLLFPTASGLMRVLFEVVDKITCRCATHVIPEGEGVKADLIRRHITRKPLKVLGHGNVKGIDLDLFSRNDDVMHKAKILKKSGVFTFVFVGRLLGDKGINELISAFDMLEKDYPYVRIILVGPDEQKLDPLTAYTNNKISSDPRIEYVGSQSDVRPFYAAADVAVLPSYREGFPNCVLEAGAMGLPQIVTDINGSREIIHQGENGLIVPTHNAEALYKAMKKMIEDKKLYRHCAANARPMIASRFEQTYVKKCLFEFYSHITTNDI